MRFPIVELQHPVSLLMPVCNEAEVIESVIEEWYEEVIRYLPAGSELVIDEAASTDGTREILQRLQGKYEFMRINYRERKDGYANAIRRLYASASCPLVFVTDSDGQFIPKDFWILAHYINTYDMVRGAKVGRVDPFGRRIASFIFNKSTHFLFNISYDDINSAFILMKRQVLQELLPQLDSMKTLINTELLLRAELGNFAIKQCYVTHRVRRFGKSRGLPWHRFVNDSIKALFGLFEIKKSYRNYN